jgi:hypothetical protein
LFTGAANAADWPHFRGPSNDGRTTEPISKWPLKEVWRASIAGGYSQVIVSQGHVYTIGWNNNQEHLYCFSETSTGTNPAPLWDSAYNCGNGSGDYPGSRTTPTADGTNVFTFSSDGVLYCFSASSGVCLWSNTTVNVGRPSWGFAGSPCVEGDLVIVDSGSIGAAVSKTTHNVVWGNTGNAGYASPFAVTIGTQRTIIDYNGTLVSGLDPATGSVLWYFGWPTSYGGIPNPTVFDGNKLFMTAGYGKGCAVVNIDGSGQLQVDGAGEWANTAMVSRDNSSVIYNDYAYGIDESVGLCCVDLSNGSRKWSLGMGMSSSVLLANNQLVVVTEDGNLIVADASPTYNEVCRTNSGIGGTWTCPTLSNGKLYIRAGSEMICYQAGSDVQATTGYRMPIQFTGYNKSGTLTNFPVLVALSSNINNSTFDYNQFVSSFGTDLRFYASDASRELNYEVEQWNPNGTSYVWVQVPTISSSNDFIWAYFGDPDNVTAPAYTKNGSTWDSTFAAVWHFSDYVPCNGMQKDSTTNHNDIQWLDGGHNPGQAGDPRCSTSAVPSVVAGGDALHGWSCDPYSDLRMTNDSPSLQCLNHSTMSFWAKSDDPSQWACVLMMGKENRLLMSGVSSSAQVTFRAPGLSGGCTGATASPGIWNYLAAVWDSGSANAYIYCNGAQSDHQTGSTAVPVIGSTDGILTIGGNAGDSGGGSHVSVDEARVDAVPRSSNWIWTCYMTMRSNMAFQTYGYVGDVAVSTGMVQFASSAYSVPENGGSATITVLRLNARSGPVTVDYSTSGGTAVAGVNYVTTTGTLSFANGETSKTFTVSVMHDGVWTPGNRTVNLTLSHTTGTAVFGSPTSAVLTIIDVDGPGSFQFSTNAYMTPQDGGSIVIQVTRANGTTGAASVNYATSDGTAAAGVNYITTASTLNFANGETSKTFTVTILNQTVTDPGKTVNLTLSNPTAGATVGSPGTAVLTIVPPGPFAAWAHSMKIFFPGYTAPATLTNFPVMLVFSNNMSGGFNYSQVMSSSGGDIRFADSTRTNILNFEIEKWSSSGSSYVWVQVPAFTNGCFIWAYWGDSATNLPACATNGATWDSTFVGVWHLGETVTYGGTQHDSTTNHNDGVLMGGGSASVGGTSGGLSPCDHLTSAGSQDDRVRVPAAASLQMTSCFTMSVWAKSDNASWQGSSIMEKYNSYCMMPSGSAGVGFRTWNNGFQYTVNCTPVNIQNWHYYAGTYSTVTPAEIIYCDGQLAAQSANCPTPGNGGDLFFGYNNDNPNLSAQMLVDEGRVENVVRSTSWVQACYLNMASNSTFCTYGSGSTGTAAKGTPISWLDAHGLTGNHDAQELGDPDGDGIPTWQEYIAGTDPTNGQSDLKALIQCAGGSAVDVSFLSLNATGSDYTGKTRLYTLEFAANLVSPVWQAVPSCSNVPGSDAFVIYTNAAPTGCKFYRVRAKLQ